MKKLKKINPAIILLLLIISPYIVAPILNNIKANILHNQINKIELPETNIVGSYSYVGLTYGNGNHTEIAIVLLVESDLSIKEIYDYYNNLQDDLYIDVYSLSSLSSDYYRLGYMRFNDELEKLGIVVISKGYYIVEIIGSAVSHFTSSYDIRGH